MNETCGHLTGRPRQICEGLDEYGQPLLMTMENRASYLQHFLPGMSSAEILEFLNAQRSRRPERMRGLGDLVARGIKAATFGAVQPCGGCRKRQEWLNQVMPFHEQEPVRVGSADISESTPRHLLMHVWPTTHGAWRWNLDQLIRRQHLFTGRRLIAIATGPSTEAVELVQEYAEPLGAEFIVVQNNPRIREGASFQKLLNEIKSEEGVTFYCHAKGSRHNNFTTESTVSRWTEAMYWACLDRYAMVEKALRSYAMAGPFRRYGMFRTPRNNRWHYSGSFYWFRNADVFSRNWSQMDRQFFAVESWPGLMFKASETACIFLDHAGDLYKQDYWDGTVLPLLKKERATCCLS